jgi:hypothetical protein
MNCENSAECWNCNPTTDAGGCLHTTIMRKDGVTRYYNSTISQTCRHNPTLLTNHKKKTGI